MSISILTIPISDFESQIKNFIQDFDTLLSQNMLSSPMEFENYKITYKSICAKVIEFLNNAFTKTTDVYNPYALQFHNAIVSHNNFGSSNGFITQTKYFKEDIACKKEELGIIMYVCSDSDVVSGICTLEEMQAKYSTTNQQLDFILDKLYNHKDEHYYWNVFDYIIQPNGIKMTKSKVHSQLSFLKKGNYIDWISDTSAKLTEEGELYIEEKRAQIKKRKTLQIPITGNTDIDTIRALIGQEKQKEAINQALAYYHTKENTGMQNQIIIISGRWHRIEQQYAMGLVETEAYNTELNKINHSLLQILADI